MHERLKIIATVWILLPISSGCEIGTSPATDGTYFNVTLSRGEQQSEYEGDALFGTYMPEYPAAPYRFSILSQGVGPDRGSRFLLHRYEGGSPGVGTYQFGRDYRLTFEFRDRARVYSAHSGGFAITEASADHVEGTLDLTAVLTCVQGACGLVEPADADMIRISGSFRANRGEEGSSPVW